MHAAVQVVRTIAADAGVQLEEGTQSPAEVLWLRMREDECQDDDLEQCAATCTALCLGEASIQLALQTAESSP
jgi:hypothetical protein